MAKKGMGPVRAFKKFVFAPVLALIALVVGLVPGGQNVLIDALVLFYTTLKYWSEGLPTSYAWMDSIYTSTSYGSAGLWFFHNLALVDLYERQLLQVAPSDDHITALCKASMYVEMVTKGQPPLQDGASPFMPPGLQNLDTYDPGTTQERVDAYAQACVEVYKALPKDSPQRKILDRLSTEKVPDVFMPKNPEASPETRKAAVAERMRQLAERPPLNASWKPAKEVGDYGLMYENTQIRPVREEWIDASEISEAVRQGKVAAFDATKLLGKEIFNMTMSEIAERHGDLAKQIPMYRQRGASAPARSGIDNLEAYAQRIRTWKKTNQIRFPENAPWRKDGYWLDKDTRDMVDARTQPTWWLKFLAHVVNLVLRPLMGGADIEGIQRQMRSNSLQCAVNTRRLPKLPVPKLEDALGNPDWLERTWSMLWLGPVADCWHYDDPDNLLISIYGDIWVTVFMQKDHELCRGGMGRGCWEGGFVTSMPSRVDTYSAMQEDPWLSKLEFIQFKLTPGTGVVVPSGAWHSLAMADGDRILMNCFMIPKYKGLWDVPAAKHSFYSSKYQTEEYHAISQLKKSAIFRLWDTKHLGGYFEGTKLEFF